MKNFWWAKIKQKLIVDVVYPHISCINKANRKPKPSHSPQTCWFVCLQLASNILGRPQLHIFIINLQLWKTQAVLSFEIFTTSLSIKLFMQTTCDVKWVTEDDKLMIFYYFSTITRFISACIRFVPLKHHRCLFFFFWMYNLPAKYNQQKTQNFLQLQC